MASFFYLERQRTHVDLNTSPMILHGLTGRFAFKKILKKPAVHSQRGPYHTHLTLYCQSTAHSDTKKLTTFLMTGLANQYLGYLRMTERMWTRWSQMRQWKVPKGELEIIKVAQMEFVTFLYYDTKFKLRAELLLAGQESPRITSIPGSHVHFVWRKLWKNNNPSPSEWQNIVTSDPEFHG